jgi:hypothetical protein
MPLITNIIFDSTTSSIQELTGGTEAISQYGSGATSYGNDDYGSYLRWTGATAPGLGVKVLAPAAELTNTQVYSIALRFSLDTIPSFAKLVDFKNQTTDNGFYLARSSPGKAQLDVYVNGSNRRGPIVSAGEVVDIIATRDASGLFTVYMKTGSSYASVYTFNDVANATGSTVPLTVGGSAVFGFLYDDTIFTGEFSPSGNVYGVKIYDSVLSLAEVATVFPAPPSPTIASATYNALTGVLAVTGTNLSGTLGSSNDIAVNLITITGQGGSVYTLTSSNVEITSSTAFSVTLNPADKASVDLLLNKNGASSTGGTIYNIAGANGWNASNPAASDLTGNGIVVSNQTVASVPSGTGGGGGGGDVQASTSAPDVTPSDTAPAGRNIQPTDDDGDGIREVITAPDRSSVDGNRDGIPDYQQTEVGGLRLINDGALGSDYGALVVGAGVRLRSVMLTESSLDGAIPLIARGGGTVVSSMPGGITNSFAGVVSFDVSGVTPGGTTQATISFPSGLPAGSGNAYVRFNYATNRFEEYVDAAGNPLYSFFDSDGDGVFDAVNLTLVDGDPNWDGDGEANGTVVDPGFLAFGERTFLGSKRKDALTGNVLANSINGKKGNDWLQGGLGIDVLIGGRGNDRYVYTSADESTSTKRDSVKVGKGDRFVFSSFDGDSSTDGQQKLRFIGKQAFSGTVGELRATRSVLEADLNGDGLADFAVNLRSSILITSNNLVL